MPSLVVPAPAASVAWNAAAPPSFAVVVPSYAVLAAVMPETVHALVVLVADKDGAVKVSDLCAGSLASKCTAAGIS